MTLTRHTRIAKISAKTAAKRKANGEHFISSTISTKPLQGGPRRKAVKKENTERQQRVAAIRRQKHSAYRRSDCYKAVEARSEGQCERILALPNWTPWPGEGLLKRVRCPNKRSDGLRMVHNHKTYARYGGKELPEDVELLCPLCNVAFESGKRGNRRFKGKA